MHDTMHSMSKTRNGDVLHVKAESYEMTAIREYACRSQVVVRVRVTSP